MKYKAYPKYKDSGVEWLGELPEHWNISSLKFICNVRDGTHDTPKYISQNEDSYPLITSKDLTSKSISFENTKFISKQDYIQISKRSFVNKNDLLMPMIGTVGGAVIVSTDRMFAIKNVALFKPMHTEVRWLKYFLNSDTSSLQFNLNQNVGVQSFVSLGDLRNLKVFKISLLEQQQIANFLDKTTTKIDVLITKQKKLIDLLDEKRQAIISHAVTKGLNPEAPMKDSGVEWLGKVPEHWDISKLKHLGDAIIGLTYSPADVVDKNKGTLVLRSSNIQNKKITFNDNVFVKTEIPAKLRTRIGDILICSRNGSRALIGKNAMIDERSKGITFGAFTTVFRSENPNFIYWILNSSLFDYQSGSFFTSTVNQLTTGNLKSFVVPVPPLSEQQQIADYLDQKTAQIDLLVEKAKQQITLLKERRTALISAAVTGKIDVRDYAA